jgi:peptidoglycan glycosyltransferase
MLESLSEFLAPPRAQHVLAFLRGAFCAAAVALVLRACFHFAPYRIGHRVRLMLFPLLFCAAALAVLACQARWQLLGFTDRRFVAYMERHNVRPDNAAHHLFRGSILDRAGRPLAYTDPDGSGRRIYPYEAATAHVVGFRHPAEGLTGMEGAADDLLSGWRELATAQDVREAGRTALQGAERHIGTNLTLTVDARLQLRAHKLLAGRKGAAVALDPRTGEVLLLCSSPSFDPNRFDRRLNVDTNSPLVNRALHGRYPPGSTFKIAIAGLLLELGRDLAFECRPGGYTAPGARKPISDHGGHVHGKLDLDRALAVSCNPYFAHAGVLCGVDAFNSLVDRIRLDERIPLYTNGAQRVSSQRPWRYRRLGRAEKRELAQRSFGQGQLVVTPLHMALLAATVANHGVMMAPHLELGAKPEALGRVFSARVADRVAAAMRGVVKNGNSKAADLPGLEVRGKTGTAQNPEGADHAWFVCFASRPGEEPSIAVAVIVENAGYGATYALPVAVGILEEFFRAP